MLLLIVLILVLLILGGGGYAYRAGPDWPYGGHVYGGAGLLGVILVVLLIILLFRAV
jgi:hypothetical protein